VTGGITTGPARVLELLHGCSKQVSYQTSWKINTSRNRERLKKNRKVTKFSRVYLLLTWSSWA